MTQAAVDNLVANLNESQQQAVAFGRGPLLVLAGPGSGKTRVLTHRIAFLIAQQVDSGSILGLTFTNKAADELSNRVESLSPNHRAWTGTFHKFCARLLRIYAPYVGLAENFTIYDTSDSRQVIKDALERAEIKSSQYSPDKIANEISRIKSAGILPHQMEEKSRNHLMEAAQRVYPVYQDLLQQSNAADFDDLLLYIVQLLYENEEIRHSLNQRYDYVLVDEYQDTNQAQYKILRGLCSANSNLMVTGDPDQSIYGWRGATISNILQFENDFENVTTLRLEQNYRSTANILASADQLISNNAKRKNKSLITDNSAGDPVTMAGLPSQQEEARFVAETIAHEIHNNGKSPKDFAVFYRVNWLSRSIENMLRTYGIPYQIVHGLEFFARKEIKDILAYLHLLNNPSDSIAIQRVINVPSRQIGKITMTRLKNYAAENRISILEAARHCGTIDTISKGVAAKIAKFVALYDKLSLVREERVEAVIGHVISATGYRDYLLKDGDEEGFQRAANVDELLNSAREFDILLDDESNLERFLEQAILVNDTDAWEQTSERVTLMTLHAAKGLEFPNVFIVGLEDGILPHERSQNDPDQMEEERRLLFVGITRAMEQLWLTYAMTRFKRGSNWPAIASKFLTELPRDQMQLMIPKQTRYNLSQGYDNQSDDFDSREYDPDSSASTDSFEESRHDYQLSPIRTAAEMLNSTAESAEVEPLPQVHPDEFQFEMLVNHPEYGTGKIVALSGEGKKRKANVEFFNGKSSAFVLLHSKLRPISRDE